MDNGVYPTLADARTYLPTGVVFLAVNPNNKKPFREGWPEITYAATQAPDYQNELARAETVAVLLGPPSCSLAVIDCDTENLFRLMMLMNAKRNPTLISRGARGGALWYLLEGDYPTRVYKLWLPKNSALSKGGKPHPKDPNRIAIGEFRGGKCASIICGRHPSGCFYCWPCAQSPSLRKLDDIIWPPEIELPWKQDPPKPQAAHTAKQSVGFDRSEHGDLLKEALARLSVEMLWDHFGYGSRRGNPLKSPFREDKHPSFSIYTDEKDRKQKWYDHATGEGGDAFDFYQCATGKSAKDAFVDFVELAGLGGELKSKKAAASETKKPRLVLPSGAVTFTEVANKAFPVLATRRRYFVRDALIVEVAYKHPMQDKQLHDVFQLLKPDAFRSRLEHDFDCYAWREQKSGGSVLKPSRCTHDAAKVLLETDEAFRYLPPISFLSAQPVCTLVGNELKILYKGYHDVHGGIYVSHGNEEIVLPQLNTAIDLILDAIKDFDFVSESDKSRAVASFISPALRIGKFLGDADFPIDISEGDQSQSGKTFRLKLICAIYGETPYVIANREGGVGSLDESISSALLAGIPFILFENFRGRMNSQLVESCLRGTGIVPARIPHRGEAQVSTTHINWQLSSNGIEATRDFVNRSVINRISKRPAGCKFASYPEGNILAHIKARQPEYLGAIFRIIQQCHAEGFSRTGENRHDFIEWAQTLDWIVQEIFQLAPLLEGHAEEVLRVSDPALSWLRHIAIAVENDNRLDEALLATEIVDIGQAHSIDFPNKVFTTDLKQLAMLAGRLLGRVFHNVEELGIDRYKIKRQTIREDRPTHEGGSFDKTYYWFRKRSAVENSH
jgi:hypothetical protein